MPIHNIRDAALKVTKACPAAGANHNTDTLDLGCSNPGASVESFEVEIAIPALPSLVGTDKYLTVKLQDSADDVTYADIEQLASFAIAGVATTGSAAAKRTVRLPSDVQRYVQANLAVTAAGGDNTAASVTVSLLG